MEKDKLESFIANQVSNIATGNKIIFGNQAAAMAGIMRLSATFLQTIVSTTKIIKNKVEIKMGYPNPPFLTIAPIGAPIKTNKKQARKEKIDLSWNYTFTKING